MSAFGDALGAIKSIILIEERVASQGGKLEKLADLVVQMDRRLVRIETTLDIVLRRDSSMSPLAISDDR